MNIMIENSSISDIPTIFQFYRIATNYMMSKNQVSWPDFSIDMVESEVLEKRQWKMVYNDNIVCLWATTLNDETIWGKLNEEASVYIHRIATHPEYRGNNFVKDILSWAEGYGKARGLKYVRLDTVGNNKGLVEHYKKAGFEYLGAKNLSSTEGLPAHYSLGKVNYFQKKI